MFKADEKKSNIHVVPMAFGTLAGEMILACLMQMAVSAPAYTAATPEWKLEATEGIKWLRRTLAADNTTLTVLVQHFPFLYDSV